MELLAAILTSSILPLLIGRPFDTLYACNDEVLELAVLLPTESKSKARWLDAKVERLYFRALVGVKSLQLKKVQKSS